MGNKGKKEKDGTTTDPTSNYASGITFDPSVWFCEIIEPHRHQEELRAPITITDLFVMMSPIGYYMSRVVTNLLHITYLHILSHHIYMLLTIFGGPFIDLSPSYKRVVEVNHPEEYHIHISIIVQSTQAPFAPGLCHRGSQIARH